jgi:hypothetical protein
MKKSEVEDDATGQATLDPELIFPLSRKDFGGGAFFEYTTNPNFDTMQS